MENKQENDKWSEQSSKRYKYMEKEQNSELTDSSSIDNQRFATRNRQSIKQPENDSGHIKDNYPQLKPTVPEDAEVCDAMVFLNRIREEYADDMVTYDNFLETMRDYKFGKIDADDVCKGVKILFKEKPHLIDIFNEYLPSHLKFYSDNRNTEKVQRNYELRPPMPQHPHFRRPIFNPKVHHPNMKQTTPLRPIIPKIVPPAHLQPPHMNAMLNGMVPNFIPHPTSVRMPNTNKIHPGFYSYMPPKTEENNSKKKQANDFIHRVKKRYANQPQVYKTFVDILQKFSSDSNVTYIRSEISTLLREHPDLIEDFEKNFIPAEKIRQEKDACILKDIFKELEDRNASDEFLRCLNYFNQSFISRKELMMLVAPILKDETRVDMFKKFINYKEKIYDDVKNLDKCKKIGSYRILSHEIQNPNQDAIAREVLNTTCVSCPTFESEDANFVFLKRNMYEDCIFKIENDRSEASLMIERFDFFIITLEMVNTDIKSDGMSIKDLEMSPGIIKEILKNLYEDSAPEILEGILNNPKTAIPVIIKRLYIVSKEYRERLRQKNKVWNDQVERSYYKALDVIGPVYKNQEKNFLASKVFMQELENGIDLNFFDTKLVTDIFNIFKIFIKISQTDNKKAAVPNLYSVVDSIFNLIFTETVFQGDYTIFYVYRLIFYAYEKLLEIKNLDLKPLVSSRTATKMHVISEQNVNDRFEEILNLVKTYCEKSLDSLDYEENVRILTDCKGYKIYNIKKVFLKIEKAIISIIENKSSLDAFTNRYASSDNGLDVMFKCKDSIFSAAYNTGLPIQQQVTNTPANDHLSNIRP